MQKIRTGILGGSFDPIHKAHVKLAQTAYREANLDDIFFIPAHLAPLRDAPYATSAEHRLAMLKIALSKANFPYSIELYELERAQISYSIDTITHLQKKYPERDFFWIIGGDHIGKLKKWKDIDLLCQKITFLCAARPDYEIKQSDIPTNAKIERINFEEMPHSASQIRQDLRDGKRQHFMLDLDVLNYILENNLYKQ